MKTEQETIIKLSKHQLIRTTTVTNQIVIRMKPVKSSNIKSIGYDLECKTLYVRFKSGTLYAYSEVEPKKFLKLLNADSKGGFLNNQIKREHKHKRMI